MYMEKKGKLAQQYSEQQLYIWGKAHSTAQCRKILFLVIVSSKANTHT